MADTQQNSRNFHCEHCNFKSVTLRRLLNHIYSIHSQDLNFKIKCGVPGCELQFDKYNSLYKHVVKHHNDLYNNHLTNAQQVNRNHSEPLELHCEISNTSLDPGIESTGENEGEQSENEEERDISDSDHSSDEDSNNEANTDLDFIFHQEQVMA